MMSDCCARLLAARHLRNGEKTEEFIKQIERDWVRNFGPMQVLQVDGHRAWSSDEMRAWCTEQGIHLRISPGTGTTAPSHSTCCHLVLGSQRGPHPGPQWIDDCLELRGAPDQQDTKCLWFQPHPVDHGLHSSHPWTFDGGADHEQPCYLGPL